VASGRVETGSAAVGNGSPVVKWVLRLLVVGYLVMLVVWPTAYVAKHTFADGLTGIQDALADPDVVHALKLTAQVAVAAVIINTVFGVGMSILLVRYTFIGKRALSALIDLPLSVSPVVVGLALVLVYNGRFGWFGPWLEDNGLQVIFAKPGMIMATCFVALPLVIREVVPVLEELGDDQEQAARSLGANAWQTFWRITMPGIRWAVPRRVRCGQGRRRQRRRRDPGRHRPRPAEVPELPAGDGVLRVLHARLRGRVVPRRRRPAASEGFTEMSAES
jgi:sulfate transport system permease protein